MKVIDLLKEKSDQLTKNHAQLMDTISPQMRDYINELVHNAKAKQQWFKSSFDLAKLSPTFEKPEAVWPANIAILAQSQYANLLKELGQVTFIGKWMTVDQQRIDAFAKVTEDYQWIHTDVSRAQEESPFGSTIAHGFLTLSLIPKLTNAVEASNQNYANAKMVVNMGLNNVRYPYPLKAGSNIRATKKLIDVQQVRNGIEIIEEISVQIENVRRPACVAQTVVRIIY